MVETTKGMGSDACPKCGSTDLTRVAMPGGNLLSFTCKACAHEWTLGALDTPPVEPPP